MLIDSQYLAPQKSTHRGQSVILAGKNKKFTREGSLFSSSQRTNNKRRRIFIERVILQDNTGSLTSLNMSFFGIQINYKNIIFLYLHYFFVRELNCAEANSLLICLYSSPLSSHHFLICSLVQTFLYSWRASSMTSFLFILHCFAHSATKVIAGLDKVVVIA